MPSADLFIHRVFGGGGSLKTTSPNQVISTIPEAAVGPGAAMPPTAAGVLAKTAAYRARELQRLAKYGPEWSDVKDAVQTSVMYGVLGPTAMSAPVILRLFWGIAHGEIHFRIRA